MVDINRIIHLGVDSEVTQLNTHQFKKGDRVVIRGDDRYYYGVVEKFYAEAFIGRGMVVKIDNPSNPEKPYIHVKFVHEGEAMLIGAKNQVTKTQIPASIERLYETINTKFIIMNADLLEENSSKKAMIDFWERFKITYDILFGSGKEFEKENFNVKALDSVFQSGIGMTLEEMVNGITGVTPLERSNPLSLIGSSLDESEKEDIKKAYREIRLGLSLFAGQPPAVTGTIPWIVKERDLLQMITGKPPESDFTITALIRYFDNDIYPTLADKIKLAIKIAGARERYTLADELYNLYQSIDKIEHLSLKARKMAAEKYTKKLQSPDDIAAMRFILGLDRDFKDKDNVVTPASSAVEEQSKKPLIINDKGGIAFNALPIQTESVKAFQGDLNAEWAQIQAVFNAGIRPSVQRISEYTAAAASSGLAADKIDQVRSMLADILRRDEEAQKLASVDPALKGLLSALEAA